MAIPQLSADERKAALEKAKAARIKRAEVRDQLKSGELTVKDVLDRKDDPIIGRMKVSTLIETLPGYGKAKSEKVMSELQIAESRRLRGLGARQEAALLERLAESSYAAGQSVCDIGAIRCWQRHTGGSSFAGSPRFVGVGLGNDAQTARRRDRWRPLSLPYARGFRRARRKRWFA